MQAVPDDLDLAQLAETVSAGWRVEVPLRHVPKGFGSYHFTSDTGRHFVTVDDLGDKPWLGDTPDAAFAGLSAAFATARRLRQESDLEFVIAPLPAGSGALLHRMSERYAVSVFDFVGGEAGEWGSPLDAEGRRQVERQLARLHGAPPAVTGGAPVHPPRLADRAHLEDALRSLDAPFHGGPFSAAARTVLAAAAVDVSRLLDTYDALVADVTARGDDPVLTHGEPHPGNLIRSGATFCMIDWDTCGLALPERDLWMLAGGGDALETWAEGIGRTPDAQAIELYALQWRLADLASFVRTLRSPHAPGPNAQKVWRSFLITIEEDRAEPYGPRRH